MNQLGSTNQSTLSRLTGFINNNQNMRPGINQRTRENLLNRFRQMPGMPVMPRSYSVRPTENREMNAPQPGGSYKKYSKKIRKRKFSRKSRKSRRSRK